MYHCAELLGATCSDQLTYQPEHHWDMDKQEHPEETQVVIGARAISADNSQDLDQTLPLELYPLHHTDSQCDSGKDNI